SGGMTMKFSSFSGSPSVRRMMAEKPHSKQIAACDEGPSLKTAGLTQPTGRPLGASDASASPPKKSTSLSGVLQPPQSRPFFRLARMLVRWVSTKPESSGEDLLQFGPMGSKLHMQFP